MITSIPASRPQASSIVTLMTLSLCLMSGLSNSASAQPAGELVSAKLIFDAQPLPVADATAETFITVADAKSSAKALDEMANPADELAKQQALLDAVIKDKGEKSAEAASALHAFADWHLKIFLENSSIARSTSRMPTGSFANMRNTAVKGGTVGDVANLNNGDSLQSTTYNLFQAKSNYLKALAIVIAQNNPSNPELFALERLIQKTLFLSTHREDYIYEPDFYLSRKSTATGTRLNTSDQELLNSPDYPSGLTSFKRVMDYIDKNKARTAQQIANSFLEEADWDLLYARLPQATEKYDSAFQFFETSPIVKERAKAIITPTTPQVLPAFMAAPNSRELLGIAPDAKLAYLGYYDVSFSIQKNGRTRGLKILGKAGNVNEAMETRLREYLNRLTFRPLYTNGKLDTDTRSFRYYVAY